VYKIALFILKDIFIKLIEVVFQIVKMLACIKISLLEHVLIHLDAQMDIGGSTLQVFALMFAQHHQIYLGIL